MSSKHAILRIASCAGLLVWLALPSVGVLRAAPPTAPPSTGSEPTINEVGGKTLQQWIDDLAHEDPSVREEAIRAIPYFGPAASKAVPALLKHIGDPDQSPRSKAVLTLAVIKIEDEHREKVIKALGERLEGHETQGPIKYDVALVLMGFHKDAKLALTGLLNGAEDTSCWEVRRICLAVLVEAGAREKEGPDPRVTRAMIHAANDSAAAVRLQGVMGLAQMGRSSDLALLADEVVTVKRLMKDHDKTVVIWAHLSMMALDTIDDPDIAYLLDASKPGELERIRVQAIGALGMVGTKKPDKVIPTLVSYLSEKSSATSESLSPAIVGATCMALGGIEDPGAKAKAALIAIAQSKDDTRVQAIYALAMIAAKDKSMVPPLIALLGDPDPNVAMTACHALGLIEDSGSAAHEAVTNLSHNMTVAESVRKYAEKVLETMGNPKK